MDKVSCPICVVEIKQAKNLNRQKRCHGLANDKICCQVLPSNDSEMVSVTKPKTAEYKVDLEVIDEAVSMILKNYHEYTRPAMMHLLRDHFPEIAVETHHLFVSVATSAARYVAGIEKVGRAANGTGTEEGGRTAKNVAESMVSWRYGLRHASRLPKKTTQPADPPPADSARVVNSAPSQPSALSVATSAKPDTFPAPSADPVTVMNSTALSQPSTLSVSTIAESDILLATLQASSIPEYPNPELEALIEEEFGCPPVINDLSVGVTSMIEEIRQSERNTADTGGADVCPTTSKYTNASRSSRHRKNNARSVPYDCRLAGHTSERDVKPYSPQPYVKRFEPSYGYGNRYRYNFSVSRRRRR